MGRKWFPKTLAEWKEPKAFVRRRVAEERKLFPWRVWLLLLSFFSLMMIGVECIGSDGLSLPPLPRLIEPLTWVLVMAALPFLPAFIRNVWIREDGILIGSSNVQRWEFEKLLRVVPTSREFDGRRYAVLRLDHLNGRSVEVAVADTISLSRIEEILRAQGVRFGE